VVLSILGWGLSQHVNEPRPTMLHCRGRDHPHPNVTISALTGIQSIAKEAGDYFSWTKYGVQYVISLLLLLLFSVTC